MQKKTDDCIGDPFATVGLDLCVLLRGEEEMYLVDLYWSLYPRSPTPLAFFSHLLSRLFWSDINLP